MSGGDFLRINYHKTCHEFIEKSLDDQGNFVTIIHQNKGLENHRVKQPDRYHLMEEQLVLSERGTWYTVDQAAQTIHKAQMSGRHLQVIPLDKRVVHLNSLLDTNHDLEWFKTHDINIRAPLCINRFCKIKEEGPEEVNRFSWFIYKNAMQIYRKSKSEWEANGRVGDAPVEPGGDNWGGKNMFKDFEIFERAYSEYMLEKSELYIMSNAIINREATFNPLYSSILPENLNPMHSDRLDYMADFSAYIKSHDLKKEIIKAVIGMDWASSGNVYSSDLDPIFWHVYRLHHEKWEADLAAWEAEGNASDDFRTEPGFSEGGIANDSWGRNHLIDDLEIFLEAYSLGMPDIFFKDLSIFHKNTLNELLKKAVKNPSLKLADIVSNFKKYQKEAALVFRYAKLDSSDMGKSFRNKVDFEIWKIHSERKGEHILEEDFGAKYAFDDLDLLESTLRRVEVKSHRGMGFPSYYFYVTSYPISESIRSLEETLLGTVWCVRICSWEKSVETPEDLKMLQFVAKYLKDNKDNLDVIQISASLKKTYSRIINTQNVMSFFARRELMDLVEEKLAEAEVLSTLEIHGLYPDVSDEVLFLLNNSEGTILESWIRRASTELMLVDKTEREDFLRKINDITEKIISSRGFMCFKELDDSFKEVIQTELPLLIKEIQNAPKLDRAHFREVSVKHADGVIGARSSQNIVKLAEYFNGLENSRVQGEFLRSDGTALPQSDVTDDMRESLKNAQLEKIVAVLDKCTSGVEAETEEDSQNAITIEKYAKHLSYILECDPAFTLPSLTDGAEAITVLSNEQKDDVIAQLGFDLTNGMSSKEALKKAFESLVGAVDFRLLKNLFYRVKVTETGSEPGAIKLSGLKDDGTQHTLAEVQTKFNEKVDVIMNRENYTGVDQLPDKDAFFDLVQLQGRLILLGASHPDASLERVTAQIVNVAVGGAYHCVDRDKEGFEEGYQMLYQDGGVDVESMTLEFKVKKELLNFRQGAVHQVHMNQYPLPHHIIKIPGIDGEEPIYMSHVEDDSPDDDIVVFRRVHQDGTEYFVTSQGVALPARRSNRFYNEFAVTRTNRYKRLLNERRGLGFPRLAEGAYEGVTERSWPISTSSALRGFADVYNRETVIKRVSDMVNGVENGPGREFKRADVEAFLLDHRPDAYRVKEGDQVVEDEDGDVITDRVKGSWYLSTVCYGMEDKYAYLDRDIDNKTASITKEGIEAMLRAMHVISN